MARKGAVKKASQQKKNTFRNKIWKCSFFLVYFGAMWMRIGGYGFSRVSVKNHRFFTQTVDNAALVSAHQSHFSFLS